ncbi:hypothetical protein Tco_0544892 [Tanacetum coccineum]
MTTLAEYMILSGADNRPLMLDKELYDSWKSRMELYMQNREYGRMLLESVEHGPFIWPTIEENRMTKTKKYAELSAIENIQADYDMKAINIILQGLPTEIYSLVNHHIVAKSMGKSSTTNASMQEMPYSEPSHFVEHSENEIHSDSNIIPYSQYLIESQTTAVQDTNSSAQQDALILYVFEQLSNQILVNVLVLHEELSDEQALHPIIDQYASSCVKIEAPWELPKVRLVNTSLKKLKYHLSQFDNVVDGPDKLNGSLQPIKDDSQYV